MYYSNQFFVGGAKFFSGGLRPPAPPLVAALLMLSAKSCDSNPDKMSHRVTNKWDKEQRRVGSAVEDIVIGARGLRFDYGTGLIEHSVANSSPSMQRFLRSCVAQAQNR